MIRRTIALLAVLLTASSAIGCSGKSDPPKSGPQTTTVEVSYDDLLNQKHITRTLALKVGDTLQVSLGSNPSTGFDWAPQMQITNATVLAQTGHEILAPSASRPGAAASEVWALQVMAPGTTTVSNAYGRPWPGGEKDSWTFTADVTVN
jgi:inhibitor of cysteine peptidase